MTKINALLFSFFSLIYSISVHAQEKDDGSFRYLAKHQPELFRDKDFSITSKKLHKTIRFKISLKEAKGDDYDILVHFPKKENPWLAKDVQIINDCTSWSIGYISATVTFNKRHIYIILTYGQPKPLGHVLVFTKNHKGLYYLEKKQYFYHNDGVDIWYTTKTGEQRMERTSRNEYKDVPIRWYKPVKDKQK